MFLICRHFCNRLFAGLLSAEHSVIMWKIGAHEKCVKKPKFIKRNVQNGNTCVELNLKR
jgi:hypothetical protein